MKLNHVNLTVTDAVETREFFEKYFGLRQIEGSKSNHGFAVLTDDSGLVLTLMKGPAESVKYPPTFHIGFIQESEERVNEINQCLKDDGFNVDPPKRLHAWTFYVQAPGGFTVEVLG